MCAFFKCWRWIEWNCAAVELKCNQDLACTYLDIAIVWVDFVRHLKLPWRLLLPPLHRTWKESWLNWRLQRTCFDWMQKSHLLRIHIFFIFFFSCSFVRWFFVIIVRQNFCFVHFFFFVVDSFLNGQNRMQRCGFVWCFCCVCCCVFEFVVFVCV